MFCFLGFVFSIGEVIAKFAQLTPQERSKRLLPLTLYIKTFLKKSLRRCVTLCLFVFCLRLNRKLENLEVSSVAWLCLVLFSSLKTTINTLFFSHRH